MSQALSKKKQVLFITTAIILGLALIELVCFVIVGNEYTYMYPVAVRDSKKIPGYFAPNQKKTIIFPGLEDYTVTTNALGLRITSPIKNEPKSVAGIDSNTKILCIGDSETFGNHVQDEDTYPYQLQSIINEKGGDAVVLNAGIGSGTVDDYLEYMNIWGLKLKPKVVVHQFFDNDLDSTSKWKKSKYEDMMDMNDFNFEKRFKLLAINRIFNRLKFALRWQKWIENTKDERAREIIREGSTDLDDNLYYLAYALGKINSDPFHEKLKADWEKYFNKLDKLNKLLKENDIYFLYVIYPSLPTMFDYGKNNYQEVIIPELEKRNIDYIDLKETLIKEKDQFLKLYTDLPRDYHLSPYSKKIMADLVYEQIKHLL